MSFGFEKIPEMDSRKEVLEALSNLSDPPRALIFIAQLHHIENREQAERIEQLTHRATWLTKCAAVFAATNVVVAIAQVAASYYLR